MSIFSRFRAVKRAADEAKGAEKESKIRASQHRTSIFQPDALSRALSAWRAQDIPLIKAQHQRRSQLSRTSSIVVVPERSPYGGDGRIHLGNP
jgi:hypothetical protein